MCFFVLIYKHVYCQETQKKEQKKATIKDKWCIGMIAKLVEEVTYIYRKHSGCRILKELGAINRLEIGSLDG